MLINGHSDLETLRRPPTINGVEQLLPTKRSEGWSVKHVRFGLPASGLVTRATRLIRISFSARCARGDFSQPTCVFRPLSRWSTVSSGRCTSRARRYREGPSGIRRSASSRDRTHRAPHSGRHQAGLGPSPSRYYGLHRRRTILPALTVIMLEIRRADQIQSWYKLSSVPMHGLGCWSMEPTSQLSRSRTLLTCIRRWSAAEFVWRSWSLPLRKSFYVTTNRRSEI